MGYILDILPKEILAENPNEIFPNMSRVETSYINAVNDLTTLEKQLGDLAKSIGDLEAQISKAKTDKANWEFIVSDISKLYDNKYMVDSYPAVEKYGSIKTPLEDFTPMSQIEGGDKACEWFGQAVCHNQQRERVKARRNYARAQIQGLAAKIPTLDENLRSKRTLLNNLQKEYATISNQKISEVKAKSEAKVSEQKAEAERLAQQQAPLLAAQKTRRYITIAAILGGVALVGAFLLIKKK